MARAFCLLIIVATVFRHLCVTLTSAQNSCSPINVSNETAGSPPMDVHNDEFYLDINNPASCTGRIVSWKVCYRGPTDPGEKKYEIVYAIYQRTANRSDDDIHYNKVSGTFSTTLKRVSDNSDDETPSSTGSSNRYTPLYEGFHCYEALDNDIFPMIQAGDIIGACVNHRKVNIIGVVNSNEYPLFRMRSNKCSTKGGKGIPSKLSFSKLSPLNSTRLHLYVDIVPNDTSTDSIMTANIWTTTPESKSTSEQIQSTMDSEMTTTVLLSSSPTTDHDSVTRIQATAAPATGCSGHDIGLKRIQDIECQVEELITRNGKLKEVFNMIQNRSHLPALQLLRGSAVAAIRAGEINLIAPVYLLSTIVNDFGNESTDSAISELLLSVSSDLLKTARQDFERRVTPPLDIAGSTLLQVIDSFPRHGSVGIERMYPRIEGEFAEINVPREVLKGAKRGARVRMASFIFRNMSGLLPERLSAENNTNQVDHVLRLASPVISASFQCENCTTSNLSTSIEITFTHSLYDKALLENDINGTTTCVFWEFEDNERQGSILYAGQWSTDGCETSFTSNSTVCRCNHLTHFAILLSAQPLDLSQPQNLALQITGYIGVSVSLVAMAATIFVFVFLKPLRTMRNYIHIQLCVTLGIAQIIFVAGVEPRLGEGSGVPIGCRSVAVLLHYWFLVSFMWMLMEGVVLYVVLVRVFIKFHGRYIAAFTIASYGLPLLYVGALTVPLGFVRTDIYRQYHSYDYGYEQACYLNPDTSFVWSLIAPVILIFLANFGFFIMAIVIMYKHQKRQNIDDKKHKVKHWIKASISLTVVMGITWIIGFLVIEIEELFALAYIFTIFVAFQGVFIFVIFVLFSKQVKENYTKWWKAKVAKSDFLSKHFGSKSLTTGTGLSAQNNNIPLPAAHGKTNGESSRSDSGISSKVFENSSGEQRLAMGSYCDLKSESYFINDESDTAVSDKHSNQANKSSKV